MALNFIKDEYPWFLETYQSYKYNIERVDSLRYFILLKYGGIYIDLDDGCRRSLDPLVKVPAWLRKTSPVGISNDAMGFVARASISCESRQQVVSLQQELVYPVCYDYGLHRASIFKCYLGTVQKMELP